MNWTHTLIIPAMLLCLTNAHAQATPRMEAAHPTHTAVGTARGGVSCDTISFDGLTSGTVVDNQYQACGVVFENAQSEDYGESTYGNVLRSSTWFDSLVVRFVEPSNASVPRPVQYFSFENVVDPAISFETDYISVRVYDTAGNLVHWESNTSASRVELDLGSPLIARVVVDDSLSTAYILDNLVFSGAGSAAAPDHTTDTGVTVYPDPFQEGVQVRVGAGCRSVRVLGLNGRALAIPAPKVEGTLWRLDLRTLAPGVYLLQVIDANGTRTVRVVKA